MRNSSYDAYSYSPCLILGRLDNGRGLLVEPFGSAVISKSCFLNFQEEPPPHLKGVVLVSQEPYIKN